MVVTGGATVVVVTGSPVVVVVVDPVSAAFWINATLWAGGVDGWERTSAAPMTPPRTPAPRATTRPTVTGFFGFHMAASVRPAQAQVKPTLRTHGRCSQSGC